MSSSNSLDRAVGQIQGMINLVVDEQKRGRRDRDEMKSSIQSLTDAVKRLSDTIDAQNKRLVTVEAVSKDINRWRERVIGACVVLSIIAAAVGGLAATTWKHITGLFQ